jgi:class 3 adenylate cyclase
MKRKIAAIFAADIAGYSRLVAEDEEETLRRLASYRAVMDDFIARAGGRIFNTAGDAVLAEFSGAVEAVRCAIDIQESLRTRNMAYPASRQMNFRIGITIGDVVERDGDLLGDGVNIAARLEGIAPVGGICISRTVHEQVANKLSVQFADIGEQRVKNIPTPVHAFKIEMRPDDGSIAAAPVKKPAKNDPKRAAWVLPAGIAAAAVVAILAAAGVYVTLGRSDKPSGPSLASVPTTESRAQPVRLPPASENKAGEHKTPNPAPAAQALVPEVIPFIADRARVNIRNEYMPAPDHKALAISTGPIGFITGQADDETAKTAALDICQKHADSLAHRPQCELYAVGNTVVFARGRPPMPPEPWFTGDPSVEKPFVANEVPLVKESTTPTIAQRYGALHKPKVLVIGPHGGFHLYNQETLDEAARRALESCGGSAGVPCLIVAIDDEFVVPIPATMKAAGFFRAASAPTIAPVSREDVAHRLANASGWTAVAAGADGRPGVMVKAANEQAAIDGALADCAKQDHSCRVIAIGPFAVEPKQQPDQARP